MTFIIGGAYQGKLDYAKEHFGLTEADIFECTDDGALDLSKKCIHHFEQYTRYCFHNGMTELPDFPEDAIVIMDDIFCGVVPIDQDIRLWREHAGRMGAAVTRKADRVIRIFCGLPQVLK